MRRRMINAQQSDMRPAVLPGAGAEAGQGYPSASAPQGITFEHDHRTKITLPINDLVLADIKLGDESARMNGLYRAVHAIQMQNPVGPLHIDFNPKVEKPKNKGGRPKGSKNKAKQ